MHNYSVDGNVIFSTHSYDGAYIGQWYTIPSESLKVCKKVSITVPRVTCIVYDA